MKRLIAAGVLSMALVHPALAHQGGHHVKGTIKELTAERLVVAEGPGKDVTFTITPATGFSRGGKPVRWDDARPGERVVVHGKPGAGSTAAEVMLGSAPPAR